MKNLEAHNKEGHPAFAAILPQLVFMASVGVVLAVAAIIKAYVEEDHQEFTHIHFVDKYGKWLGTNVEKQVEHALKCDGKYVIVTGKAPDKRKTKGTKRSSSIAKLKVVKPEVVSG
jgi:hypothetical protein